LPSTWIEVTSRNNSPASLMLTSPTDRSITCSHLNLDRYAENLVVGSAATISNPSISTCTVIKVVSD
jgi:hypothetical protein